MLHDQTGGYSPPVFFGRSFIERTSSERIQAVALQEIVEQTVTGLGYELVDVERSAGGLLRITIDLPWVPGNEQFVNVEDCEKVTRQLQFALEVEGTEYKRLEVSSPGIDRPLRTQQDFERFAGREVDVTLKAPMGQAAGGQVAANRKMTRLWGDEAGRATKVDRMLVLGAGEAGRRRALSGLDLPVDWTWPPAGLRSL